MTTNVTTERKPNPYNAKKSWHKPDRKLQSADESLFVEREAEATPENNDGAQKQNIADVNYKKRYDDLKRHHDQTLEQMKADLAKNAVENVPTQELPKELQDFKKEYPDLFKTMESVSEMKTSEGAKGLEAKIAEIAEQAAEIRRREAKLIVRQDHPDFDQITNDDAFHQWVEAQPEQIQDWVYKNPDNPQLASRAISFYKAETGVNVNRQSLTNPMNSAADMVSTRTTDTGPDQPKIWTESEISRMAVDEYDRHEAEIDLAVREGRIVKGR